jgi:hypothetical protein
MLKPLTEEERLNAGDRARELVKRKYPKPAREQTGQGERVFRGVIIVLQCPEIGVG